MPQDKAQSALPDTSSPSWSKAALSAKNASTGINPRVQRLMELGQSVVCNKKWAPKDGKTYCNFAVSAIAVAYGYKRFTNDQGAPIMANEIARRMESDKTSWRASTAQDAWDNALLGGLSVAAYQEAPHGHVAVVAPTARVFSQKWSAYVPAVYNVGATINSNPPYSMGEGFAFRYQPNHYIYLGA